jgi:hypothetical protein
MNEVLQDERLVYPLISVAITLLAAADVFAWRRLRRTQTRVVWTLWLVPASALLTLCWVVVSPVLELLDPELAQDFMAFYAWRILFLGVPALTAFTFLAHLFAGLANIKRREQVLFWGNALLLLGFVSLVIGLYSGIDWMGH